MEPDPLAVNKSEDDPARPPATEVSAQPVKKDPEPPSQVSSGPVTSNGNKDPPEKSEPKESEVKTEDKVPEKFPPAVSAPPASSSAPATANTGSSAPPRSSQKPFKISD